MSSAERWTLPLSLLLWGATITQGQFGPGTLVHDLENTSPAQHVDVDGDGDQDLVFVVNGHHVKWMSNNGSGFEAPQNLLTTQDDIALLHFFDKDLDGDMDLVFMEVGDEDVQLCEALGNGPYAAPADIHETFGPVGAISSADITGDGFPEVLYSMESANGSGITWIANANGTLGGATEVPDLHIGLASPYILAGDLDLIGGVDLVLSDGNNWLVAALNTAGDATTWQPQLLLSFPQYTYNTPQLLDVDADGLPDVVGSGPTAVHWARNQVGEGGAWNAFSDEVIEPWLSGGPASFGHMGCGTGASVVFVPNNPALPVRWATWMSALGEMTYSADLPEVPRGTRPMLMDVDGDGREDLFMQQDDGLYWYPNLTVPPTTDLELPAIDTLCLYGDPYLLPASTPAGARWSGEWVIDNVFYRSNLTGSHNVALGGTLYEPAGCPVAAGTTVSVVAEPQVFPDLGEPICSGDGPIAMSSAPATTAWSGLAPGNVLDPATYTGNTIACVFTDNTGAECVALFNATVWTSLPAQIAPAGPFCVTDGPQLITAASAPPAGRIWSGDITGSNSAGATFDPSFGQGTYTVVLTVEPTGPQQCIGSDTLTISVSDDIPEVSIAPLPPICAEGASFQLSGGFPAGGIWSGTGISNGFLDPNTIGPGSTAVAYSYRAPEGCSATAFQFIDLVDAAEVAHNAPDLQLCSGDGGVQFTGIPEGGTWASPLTSTGILQPAALGSGSYPISYTWNGPNGCVLTNTSLVAEVLPPTPVSIEPMGVLCDNGLPVALNGSVDGTWSGAVSGQGTSILVDPAALGVGNWIVSLTGAAEGFCPGTGLATIVVEICTGMEENAGMPDAVLVPNPFSQNTTLLLNTRGEATVEVLDATGRLINTLRTAQGANALTIDLQGEPNGTYLIRVRTAGGLRTLRAVKVD